MHRPALTMLLVMVFLFFPISAAAATGGNVENEQPNQLNMTDVENYVDQLNNEINQAVPDFDFKQLVKSIASGDIAWSPLDLFKQCFAYLFREVVANLDLLGKLIILAVICAVLQNLAAAFEKGTTGQLSYMVTFLILVTIAVGSFGLAVQAGREVVDQMVTFMQALLPVMLTLLVAAGGVTTAAIMHPVIFTTITAVGTIIKNIVLPLIFFAAVLDITSHLSSKFQVSRLGNLLKTGAMSALGIMTTIFLGLLSIQGVAGAVGDSVALRTAKFAAGAFIPVVGGMFKDALEAVVGSSLLLKNAVGIGGMVVICLMMAIPLLKILSLAFIYKLAGALIQPVGDNQTANCLNSLSNSLLTVFGAVATVGLLFFFSVTIVLAVGNFMVMLR